MTGIGSDDFRAGQVVRRLREAAALTPAQVAERLGQPEATIEAIEDGDRSLSVWEVIRIGQIVGHDPAEIVRAIRYE